MRQIYAVHVGAYSDEHIIAVFDDEAEAARVVEWYEEHPDIHEMWVRVEDDAMRQRRLDTYGPRVVGHQVTDDAATWIKNRVASRKGAK